MLKRTIVHVGPVRCSSMVGFYSRVVIEAPSTQIGFSCRTNPISLVVVCTTDVERCLAEWVQAAETKWIDTKRSKKRTPIKGTIRLLPQQSLRLSPFYSLSLATTPPVHIG